MIIKMKKTKIQRLLITAMLGVFLGASHPVAAQTTRKVLFLGNSYTGVNNLPKIVQQLASAAGDSLIFTRYTPGGYTLNDHFNDPTSQNHIQSGGWDYVVLQGQSQEPVVQTTKFNLGAQRLQNLIHQHNPCSTTLLYMTWGRKNGDASTCATFPLMCTYRSMDSTLRQRYLQLARSLQEEVAPVSVVWRSLRQNQPAINLYQADESHPSKAGSYAAACTFYATLFGQSPSGLNFHFGLSPSDASAIQNAAKARVSDSLSLWNFKQKARSSFNYRMGSGSNEVIFNAVNRGVRQTYHWDFGNGDSSALANPRYSYAANGTYTVTLTTTNCHLSQVHTSHTDTVIQFCAHTPTIFTRSDTLCRRDTLWTQPADTYQWFAGGQPIPETRQFVAHYGRYNSFGFSVRTSVNGCAELSQNFTAQPHRTGYFFDAAFGGDPCAGDTALFIVKHVNGILPGSAQIFWYKDGQLLPQAQGDTLFIFAQGKYQSGVVDSLSACPADTVLSSVVVFDCGSLQVKSPVPPKPFSLYPNPAGDVLYLKNLVTGTHHSVRFYNSTGQLQQEITAPWGAIPLKINISTWPSGLYYVQIRGKERFTQKFVKQ